MMEINQTLDAKGLSCPIPIVKTKKAMDQLNSGDILEVLVTDKGALSDMPAWAKSGGHQILNQTLEDNIIKFLIQKA